MRQATKNLAYLAGAAVSVLYLLNPGAGVVEILPDNLPFVGNLDEAAFVGLLLSCVRGLRRSREESGTALRRA
jgi:uncharacterized membrane protein YkvA (DUF1232 family)